MRNKWLMKFKQKHVTPTDKPDTVSRVSVLSVPTPHIFLKNKIIGEENNGHVRTDKPDTVKRESVINQQLSVLSVPTNGYLEEKDRLNFQETPLNRTDRTDIVDQYEERVAIAEYDGGQSISHAHRIAYNSALVEYINAHPTHSIVAAQDFLMTLEIPQPKK